MILSSYFEGKNYLVPGSTNFGRSNFGPFIPVTIRLLGSNALGLRYEEIHGLYGRSTCNDPPLIKWISYKRTISQDKKTACRNKLECAPIDWWIPIHLFGVL